MKWRLDVDFECVADCVTRRGESIAYFRDWRIWDEHCEIAE